MAGNIICPCCTGYKYTVHNEYISFTMINENFPVSYNIGYFRCTYCNTEWASNQQEKDNFRIKHSAIEEARELNKLKKWLTQ